MSPRSDTVQQLGPTECVSILHDVCVADGDLVVSKKSGPLRLCGEFGTDWLQPAEFDDLPQGEDALVLVGGFRNVSTSNVYHLLHTITPLVWQLWHPTYAPEFPKKFDIVAVHPDVGEETQWDDFWWSLALFTQ